jgi:CBS domain-containing protein
MASRLRESQRENAFSSFGADNATYTETVSPSRQRVSRCHRAASEKWSHSMTSVAQILKSKPNQSVYTIAETDSVYNAVKLMAEHQIGAVVVTDGDKIAGIITERDYARKIVLMDRSSKATPVQDIMTRAVIFVRPDQSSDECMALMTERRMRHLPVIDQERLVGMISIGDLVKNVIAEQEFTIQQLEHYITGERT